MQLSYLISFLFYGSVIIYCSLGVYIFTLHTSSALHRSFFLLCLSLGIWAFTYSVATCAPDYEECLFWRQIAVFGWGFIYSFLLHFILILTEKQEVLRQKGIYVLLYLPCLINIYANFLNQEIARRQFELIYTATGWINISKTTGWDYFYYCYYFIFTVISIAIIWQWGRKSAEYAKKRQSFLIIFSYSIALVLGTFTEILINIISVHKVPQIGPLIIVFPILVMFYCIRKYDLIPTEKKEQKAEAGAILSEATRATLYNYLAVTYVSGAALSFALRYYALGENPRHIFLISFAVCLIGLLLYLAEVFNLKHKKAIQNFLIVLSIPVVNLLYAGFSAVYGWFFPVMILLISIVSSQKRFTLLAAASIIGTFFGMWILEPTKVIRIDNYDHFLRIFIFLMVIGIAYFIKKAYTQRLLEYEEQVRMQKLAATVSADLVSANEHTVFDKLLLAIRRCGEYLEADFAHLFLFDEEGKPIHAAYVWCPEVPCQLPSELTEGDLTTIQSWMENYIFSSGEVLCVPSVSALPDDGKAKPWLMEREVKSFLSIPLVGENRITGCLCFSTIRGEKNWEGQRQLLRTIARHLTDVWLKVSAERELKHMAFFDGLTSLPNRTQFSRYLKAGIARAAETDTLLGVIYLDLDFFKTVNDLMGHDSGDELLRQFGLRLTRCLREGDVLARFGGDEFLIMLPHFTDIQDVQKVADRILEAAWEPVRVNGQDLFVTASMGIAVYPDDGETPEDLIKNADLALYTSKETGRSKYTICSTNIKREFVKKNELTSALYLAMDRNELALYYQPKVNPKTGEIIGIEALVRWQHPEKGLLLPGAFIPLAEKIGVIQHIDQWVFRTACQQSKLWQEQGLPPTKMAVNFSLAHFYSENILGNVWSILRETDLDPSLLEIEITESVAYYRSEAMIDILSGLKALGIAISIDDFGTEYSSLIRLQTLPIDRIKIDRQFVSALTNGSKGEDIIKAIFTLSEALDLKVTMEGVENEQQLAFARSLFCDEVQGYYFYKPMPAEEIEILLRQKAARR